MSMTCHGFQDRLDDWLAARVDPAERSAIERHLASCDECRELATFARDETPDSVDGPADLVGAVLARTSGNGACGSAAGRMCDFVDGALEPLDAQLVSLHLERCAECRALESVLVRMSDELPALAELDPGPGFAARVIRATVPLGRRASRRLDEWVLVARRLLDRPRIALEGAYLGAAVLTLLFFVPGSPMFQATTAARELTRTNPIERLREPATEIEVRVTAGAEVLWREARTRVIEPTRAATVGAFERIVEVGTLLERAASEKASDDSEANPPTGTQGERE